jgi:hypothetical protein
VTGVSFVPIVLTLLVPIVTAMAGILGVMLQDWRVRKSQAGRRKLALEDASRQVSFAVDWWNARKLIADSPGVMQEATRCAEDWLEEASTRVIRSKPAVARQRSPITFRRLLLLYPLQGRAANIIRGFFYVSLAFLILGVGTVISEVLDAYPHLYGDFIGLIFVAILTLVFRFWAASAQNLNSGTRRTWPKRLRRALLLYRLHSGSASLIRIIFYGWIVFWALQVPTNVSNVQENRNSFPVVLAALIALIGLAVGLRYWAASLARTPDTGKANDQHPAETTVFVAEEASAKNWWESLPDQNRLQYERAAWATGTRTNCVTRAPR